MENNDKQIELKFQRFFTVNFPKVKNFAQMLLKSESDAEDVAQDVFCKLWLQPELWLNNDKELDNYIFIMTLKSATPFPKCYLHKEKWTFDS